MRWTNTCLNGGSEGDVSEESKVACESAGRLVPCWQRGTQHAPQEYVDETATKGIEGVFAQHGPLAGASEAVEEGTM